MFGARSPRNNPFVVPDWTWAQQDIQAELDAYEGAIAQLDHHLGLPLAELQRRGLLENTVIIVTSDHGEEFGEHKLFEHGNSLYLQALHVPLLISFPSLIPPGKDVHETVSLRDLPATVLDLIKLDGGACFPGDSLVRYWDDRRDMDSPAVQPVLSEVNKVRNNPGWFPASKGDMKSLVVDRYHYIKNGDGREELYDFEHDPWEKRDLADSEEGPRVLTRVRKHLLTFDSGVHPVNQP